MAGRGTIKTETRRGPAETAVTGTPDPAEAG